MNTEARVEVGVVGGGVVLQSGWTFVSKSVYNRGTGPNLGTLMLCSYTTRALHTVRRARVTSTSRLVPSTLAGSSLVAHAGLQSATREATIDR